MWLESYLKKWENTLVIVSHDRNFLNEVCTDIIHFVDRKLIYYKGNFSSFERTRRENLIQQKRTYEAQQKQKQHIETFINRFRYSTRASQVQQRLKMLEKMDFVDAVAEDPTFSFELFSPEVEKPPYIQALDISFSYTKGKEIFKKLNFAIDGETRIALVGKNGAGYLYLSIYLLDLYYF